MCYSLYYLPRAYDAAACGTLVVFGMGLPGIKDLPVLLSIAQLVRDQVVDKGFCCYQQAV